MTDSKIEVFQEAAIDAMLKPLAEIVTSAGQIAEGYSRKMAEFYREYYKRAGVTLEMSFKEKTMRLADTLIDDLLLSDNDSPIKERFTRNCEEAMIIASQKGPLFDGMLKIKTIFSTGMYGEMVLKLFYLAQKGSEQIFMHKGGIEGLLKAAHYSLTENTFYFCQHCDGFIKGYPGGKYYSTPCMGLAGGSGTNYSCKRCDEILVNDAFCSS